MFVALFLIFFCACSAAAATGVMFPPGDWYGKLTTPRWTPPDWMFPVAWTVLYIMMSIAAARLAMRPGSGLALAFWSLQIALNTLWTPVFFGLRQIETGLIVLIALWVAVVGCVLVSLQVDQIAGLLLLPYLLWVSLAFALNLSILQTNPRP